jgi:hypothetical protein
MHRVGDGWQVEPLDLTTTVGQDLILEWLAYQYVCMLHSSLCQLLVPQGDANA